MINKEKIEIKSAHEIEKSLLFDFYKQAYPAKYMSMVENWSWQNRCDFIADRVPLVAVYENKAIAHAGMIPFSIYNEKIKNSASWFIDFKVLDAFQGMGVGSLLTKEWMKITDVFFAAPCNDMSMGVFKKHSWLEYKESFMHLCFVRPFDYPVFQKKLPESIRKLLNRLSFLYFKHYYRLNSLPENDCTISKLSVEIFNEFYNQYQGNKFTNADCLSVLRDESFYQWRVFASPNYNRYYLFKHDSFSAVFSLHDLQNKFIDVLWCSDTADKNEIMTMISTLSLHYRDISHIRFYTNRKEVSDFLQKRIKSIVRYPKLAFCLNNCESENNENAFTFDFELIDNDFEHIS